MKKVLALTFDCPLELADLRDRATATGPWLWIPRDNDQWGEYTSSRVHVDYGMAKIYPRDEGGYLLNVLFESKLPDDQAQVEYDKLHAAMFDVLLPALGASNLTPSENFR